MSKLKLIFYFIVGPNPLLSHDHIFNHTLRPQIQLILSMVTLETVNPKWETVGASTSSESLRVYGANL